MQKLTFHRLIPHLLQCESFLTVFQQISKGDSVLRRLPHKWAAASFPTVFEWCQSREPLEIL